MGTVFELLTTLAFLYFAKEKVDIAVIEAGLGGRYDSTIVIEPILTILTPIAKDHTDVLGDTIIEIARDKCFSIKENTPALTEQWSDVVKDEINRRAIETNSKIYYLSRDFNFHIIKDEMDETGVSFSLEGQTFRTNMTGFHQAINGGLAVVGSSLISRENFNISDDSIREGLRRARVRGRLEFVSREPAIIIDGAHNPFGMKILSESLTQLKYSNFTLIIGMNRDKLIRDTLQNILPLTSRVIATSSSHPLAMPADELKSIITEMGFEAETCLDMERCMLMAIKRPPILVTGSLYLVADYLRYFG